MKIKKKMGKLAEKKRSKLNGKSKINKKKIIKGSDEYTNKPLDEFLEAELNKSDSEESDNSEANVSKEINESDLEVDNEELEESSSDASGDEMSSHKVSLAKLKDTDPEFFNFLQENDKKLLNFNLSDSEHEDGNDDDEETEIHKPSGNLEIASDESDFEPEDADEKPIDKRIITLRMLKQWQTDIHTDKSSKTINCLVQAFHAALVRISSEEQQQQQEVAAYKVDGSSVFNAVIQICVLELGPAFRRFLRLPPGSKQPPHKCKRFVKIKGPLQSYFKNLSKLIGGVTSTNILNVLLKHLHNISPLMVSFQQITKQILKRLIHLWGTADDSVRVVAFLCILRITNNQQMSYLNTVLKSMYLTYITNSKFVSVGTLPMINFMRRSLTEMFALDLNVSYQHVFLYIRQLAIHLRNAVTVQKKENNQAVYNWQFINSLKLWGNLLGATCNKPHLQPLIYPFVQITIGVMKLLPTPQFYPLRFHCVGILMELSTATGTFIPIIPFLLEVLLSYDFNKKHQKVSMKPMNFVTILRCSKSQLSENGFKDTTVETVYEKLLEYLANQSNSIAFPDLSLICVIQIKQFLKKCAVANYSKKMRQLLEKVEQSRKFIENERQKISFNITDLKLIESWETTVKNNGTPLSTYYESWSKLRTLKKNKLATANEDIGDYNLPQLKKKNNKPGSSKKEKQPVTLFPSDSESDDEDTFGGTKKSALKRGKRAGKKQKNKKHLASIEQLQDNTQDIVQNIDMSDW